MKIAILGVGVVGRGVYEIINNYFTPEIQVKYVLDLRPLEDIRCIKTTNIDDIVGDPEVELVVETIGPFHPSYDFVCKALEAGKHVVTPNKAMVSAKFHELQALATAHNAKLLYTPSAGGGIPWLYNLLRTKRAGGIQSFKGIINGTTNYILDTMEQTGGEFADILADAQKLGYAEANPAADIDGIDVRNKCAISANLGFGLHVDPAEIHTAGIRYILKEDITAFSKAGLRCKLMCNGANLGDGKVAAYVEPVILKKETLEANVPKNFNMVFLTGPEVGELGFYGQGAGRYPTAHSMVEDIVDIYNGVAYTWQGGEAKVENDAIEHRYYVRTEDASLKQLAVESFGTGFITAPMSVSRMHEAAAGVIAAGTPVFFAGIRE